MKIVIIIVLYNKKISDSETLSSIEQIARNFNLSSYDLIIYDNSPEVQEIPITFPVNLFYYHDSLNGGLSAAYNYAYHYCIENKNQWLLLLDQDTELSVAYFSEIERKLSKIAHNEEIVGVLPQIFSSQKKISPVIVKRGGFVKGIADSIIGICNIPVTGINSGTILKVDFIKSINGFNPDFKLDLLDYWYFKEIYRLNKKVYILKTQLKHNLSVMDYKQVSTERYKNIIKSEFTFFRNYCSKNDLFAFKIRLILRLIKQFVKVKNKKIAKITLGYILFKNAKNKTY